MNAFAARTAPMTRLQLPSGLGRTISVGGIAYTADKDGFVEVPRDMAEQLASHIAAAPDEVLPGNAKDYALSIEKIDARVKELQADRATLDAAIRRAREMGGPAGPDPAAEVAELATKRRSTIADMILGLAKRTDVEAIEVAQRKASAKAAEQAQAREFAALGVAELEQRAGPLDAEFARLQAERALAVRRLLRLSAEQAAREYLESAQALGRKLAALQAHALELERIERPGPRGEEPAGGRCSFGVLHQHASGHMPVFNQLGVFAHCHSGEMQVRFDQHLDSARAELRKRFTEQGWLR